MARSLVVFLVVCTLVGAAPLRAADVHVEVSSRETPVGVPVLLTIEIADAKEYTAPEIPEIANARMVLIPGENRSTMTQIINGRMSQSTTVRLRYRITPLQPGLITIPALAIIVDEVPYESRPIEIAATAVNASAGGDADDGDLLRVEVTCDRARVFLGEPVRLTLRIRLRPFRDPRFREPLTVREMYQQVRRQQSSWGPFAEVLDEMSGSQVLVDQPDGSKRMEYHYETTSTFAPTQAGPLTFEPVLVLVAYPTRLERDFVRWAIGATKQLAARAEPPDVEVVAPPAAGRPDVFAGAVGRFRVHARATPVAVAVGDPITLTLTISDATQGGADLRTLAPPPLDRVQNLASGFRIPGDPLGGRIEGRRKIFTQTLHATSDRVTEIPPIPFAFFDPIVERYEVVHTDAIPLEVQPAARVATSEIVAADGAFAGNAPAATELRETTGGLLACYTDPDALLAAQDLRLGWPAWLVLGLPPLLFAGIAGRRAATRIARSRNGRTGSSARRRSARRRALERLRAAPADPAAAAEAVSAALRAYVAERCDLPAGITRDEVRAHLSKGSIDTAVYERIDTVLTRCERVVYAGLADGDAGDLAREAEAAVIALERERP